MQMCVIRSLRKASRISNRTYTAERCSQKPLWSWERKPMYRKVPKCAKCTIFTINLNTFVHVHKWSFWGSTRGLFDQAGLLCRSVQKGQKRVPKTGSRKCKMVTFVPKKDPLPCRQNTQNSTKKPSKHLKSVIARREKLLMTDRVRPKNLQNLQNCHFQGFGTRWLAEQSSY